MAEVQTSPITNKLTKWVTRIAVALAFLVLACFVLWQGLLWLNAVTYASRFQQALDEQCPNSGIVVSPDKYSWNPYNHWSDAGASYYQDPTTSEGKIICRCRRGP
jgi:hypothetical protein